MSRFRRLGLAATAAAAVLALAIAPNASAISINTGPSGTFSVTPVPNSWTFYSMPAAGAYGVSTGVTCAPYETGAPVKYGWGIAEGQDWALFVPPFREVDPVLSSGCWFVEPGGESSAVSVHAVGALVLTLTGLAPGQNPSSPQRKYNGRLWLHSYSEMSFRPAKYPGCWVTVHGPQSVDLPVQSFRDIVVDDDKDQIDVNASGATFAITKTAACPSTIGNSMSITQTAQGNNGGWRFNNVTVTP